MYRSIAELAKYVNAKTLIMDHNNVTNVSRQRFPQLPKLETLSLSYNAIRELDETLITLSLNVSLPCFACLSSVNKLSLLNSTLR